MTRYILLTIISILATWLFLNYFNYSLDHIKIPTLKIETPNDTVKIGEVYQAKLSLSDTSLLWLKTSSEYRRIHPYFKINDSLIYTGKDEMIFKYQTQNEEELPYFKEFEYTILFPHPEIYEGDIMIKRRIGFLIIE